MLSFFLKPSLVTWKTELESSAWSPDSIISNVSGYQPGRFVAEDHEGTRIAIQDAHPQNLVQNQESGAWEGG